MLLAHSKEQFVLGHARHDFISASSTLLRGHNHYGDGERLTEEF